MWYSSLQSASLLRELTCHMESHSVTCHPAEVTYLPLLQPAKTGTQFSDPSGMQGWVDLAGLVIYLPEDCHPSQYWLGSALSNFIDATNDITTTSNHQAAVQPLSVVQTVVYMCCWWVRMNWSNVVSESLVTRKMFEFHLTTLITL